MWVFNKSLHGVRLILTYVDKYEMTYVLYCSPRMSNKEPLIDT